MVYFPARKCYHAAKIGLLLILVVALLTLFEQWRGGKRSAGATFSDPIEAEFERQILEDEARIIPGLGEGGVAAHLVGEDKRLGEESEKKLAMNVYLSDRISYNRTLKDNRNPACARVIYDAELPSASVILIFHNEPYSVVVRTIWSVINSARRTNEWFRKANFVERNTGRTMTLGYPGQDPSSPFVYLKEIILVDDNSTLPELKGKMSHYVRTRLPPDLIRILRLPDRQGLMKARMRGARAARGDVLIFLDAHCEANTDWLRPLLQRVQHKRDAILTPLIDVIDQTTFQIDAAENFQVGGFTFTGHFTWIDVPEREKKRRGSDIGPTWSPTMAGGLFAINRAYYWELGAYDEQMAGWGGENLEMSFRVWQCGGTLETIPCSRVGHVFRSFHPYGMPADSDTHGINTARMAEVWMDEYAELFYLHRPDLRNNVKIGDVTHRKILREKLHCKSFQWYLDNIYKEKFVPVRDVYGYGRFSNPSSGLCLDTMQREGDGAALGVYPCHNTLQATQYLSLSLAGELRDEENCAQLQYRRQNEVDEDVSRIVQMSTCHGKQRGQKWEYDAGAGWLRHVETGLCLSAGREAGADAAAAPCARSPDQRWLIDYAEYNNFVRNDIESSDRDIRLKRLRGQRRISRSLLSYDSSETNSIDDALRRKSRKSKKHKRHGKHSKRTKNKFIVKLARTLMNGTEDHLEVDIHCRHRQLYPNNSFVRDLVTILNDKNIKVINNGRVFEKNKVTEVGRGPSKVLNKLDILHHDPHEEQLPKKQHSKKHKNRVSTVHAVNIATQAPARDAGGAGDAGDAGDTGDAEGAGGPSTDAASAARGVHDKRIIIEDFVELRPSTFATVKRPKKHKHGRGRGAPAPPAAPPPHSSAEGEAPLAMVSKKRTPRIDELVKSPGRESEEQTVGPPQDSMEDTPMLASESERDAHTKTNDNERDGDAFTLNEDWPVGQSRFRSKTQQTPALQDTGEALQLLKPLQQLQPLHQLKPLDQPQPLDQMQLLRRHTHKHHCAHTQAELSDEDQQVSPKPGGEEGREVRRGGGGGGGGGATGKPVRLVMRTNLTFNLGKEFFQRAQQLAQAQEPAEELIVPSDFRDVPPIDLLVAPPRVHEPATPPPPGAQPDSAASHQSSSSSESSDDS